MSVSQSEERNQWIAERVREVAGRTLRGKPVVFTDTSRFMSIDRDHLVELDGTLFLIRCNERELRCGLSDQPKFWVKRALSLDSGATHILKLVIREEFKARIGPLEIRCERSEEKEGAVLDYVRGDDRFMQGYTARDEKNNLVRIIDFIRGPSLLAYLHGIEMDHEEYFFTRFPAILAKTIGTFQAIDFLHEVGLCHGDIRNDHILIDRETGRFRWIDFDLTQDFGDYDVVSLGNILHVVVAKRLLTFKEAIRQRPDLDGSFDADEGAAFFPHRVMNLRKVYPYVPEPLNRVLMRFSLGTEGLYESVAEVIEDLGEAASMLGAGEAPAPEEDGDESSNPGD